MARILITGGAGFIGLHLANRLLDIGHEVVITDNFSRAVRDPELVGFGKRKNAKIVEVDMLNKNSVLKLGTSFEVIFHLAAIIGVAHVLARPYAVLVDNIGMLSNVIALAKKQTLLSRLLYASTSEIYAGTQARFNLDIPTSEEAALAVSNLRHPRTSYMLSKMYGEAMCLQSELPITIFRPHNVYGPRMGLSHVIPELCQKAIETEIKGELEVYSTDHTRTFCYVSDAVEQLISMSLSIDCQNETLNLGSQSPEISIGDVAKIILNVVKREDLKLKGLPPSSGSPSRRCPDMTKTTDLIGFSAKVSLDDGIEKTFKWYEDKVFKTKGLTSK